MKRMLFNATYAEELRVAAVDGQRLINFDIETSSKEQRRGNIYKGFVTRVEPSLEACFVDYGTEKQGFLPFKEIDYAYLPEVNGQRVRDFSKLPLGTELIIQVEKDERGNKGAALTTYITLPGRYLVLMPNNSRAGGISRRIEGEEREELRSSMAQLDIQRGMSVILRTAALGRVVEELQWDLTYLTRLWEMIVAASKEKGAFLIYLESSLVIRSIRDHFSPDISEVLIDTEEVYQQARKFMSLVMPNFADRIKLYHDDVPLFSRFQIEHQIESAYSRTVTLPSGGVIVIDHTEALTSVDVNSAKANKGADIEATAFLTNVEAAEEVARQLRLRDLGGLVVVDFIDMENQKNQRELENHFKTQLGLDRARIQMGKLSKFGLLELSRQRLQSSLDESTTIACPRCAGVGSIRGIESSALHLLRIIQEEVVKNNHQLSALHVQLPVDVATYLLNERREDVAKIEARMKVKIILIPNIHLNSPQHKIKRLSYDVYDSNFNKSSYNLVETPEETLGYKSTTKKVEVSSKVPVVQEVTHQQPAPVIERKKKSLFAVLAEKIASLFAPAPVKPANNGNRRNNNRNNNGRNLKPRIDNKVDGDKSSRNKDNLKTRPVPVARNNNKIQTVRPTANNNGNQAEASNIAKLEEVALTKNNQAQNREERRPATGYQENNRRSDTNNNKQSETRLPAKLARKVAPATTGLDSGATAERAVSQRDTANRNSFEKRDNVNTQNKTNNSNESSPVAERRPVIDKNEATNQEPRRERKADPSHREAAVGANLADNSAAVFKVEASAKPVATDAPHKLHQPVLEVYVAPVIDLGGLELVATKTELLNRAEPQIQLDPVKRFSDLVIEEKYIDPNITFELIETKK